MAARAAVVRMGDGEARAEGWVGRVDGTVGQVGLVVRVAGEASAEDAVTLVGSAAASAAGNRRPASR